MADRGGPMDRGWNDPPMLGLESCGPPKSKLQLNKRVAYPSLVTPNSEVAFPTAKHNESSEIASSPPRLHPFLKGGPPRACNDPPLSGHFTSGDTPITCPIPTPSLSKESASADALPSAENSHSSSFSSSLSLSSKEKRAKVIAFMLSLCEESKRKNWLPEKQVNDIRRKIGSLEQQWTGESAVVGESDSPLSSDAEDKLLKMVEAAEDGKWDVALKIQVALAVDHAGMVKKWVMAVKKLLLTAQSHSTKESSMNQQQTQKPPQYFLPSTTNH